MEDYQKVIIVGAGLNDLAPSGPPYHIFVDAVLIDKSHPHGLHPILYQVSQCPLSEALVSPSLDHFLSMQKNAFVLMGDVLNIDKRAKIIHLADGHSVSYKYLVVMSGSQTVSSEAGMSEFTPGVQALVDAMKIHERLRETFEPTLHHHEVRPNDFVQVHHHSSQIAQLAKLRMAFPKASLASLRALLMSRHSRLFQVET